MRARNAAPSRARNARVTPAPSPLVSLADALRIATSPLPRALKTAQIVADVLGKPDLVEVFDELRADRDAASIRAWIATRQESRLMIVGHNPSLSNLLALLTTGDEHLGFCDLRKGGIAALTGDPRGLYQVDWIARPKLFRV